jgi:acyl-CoA thioesterase-1
LTAPHRLIVLLALAFFPLVCQAQTSGTTIVAFGDSLTAGLGVAEAEAWPAVLERSLRAAGLDVRIVNAGVSGDTTAGGRARLAWSLAGPGGRPDIVIVALGGNDALRGLATAQAQRNLDAILAELKQKSIRVLLAGMLAPPNFGREYGRAFAALYRDLAAKYNVPLYPFILDGVAADPALNQADGIHPTAQGQAIIAQRIEPYVRALLAPR